MDFRFTFFFCFVHDGLLEDTHAGAPFYMRHLMILIVFVSANPYERTDAIREKRDVMDSIKDAGSEVVKTLSDAGDAAVDVFKPTEKSTSDKVADSIKGLTQ